MRILSGLMRLETAVVAGVLVIGGALFIPRYASAQSDDTRVTSAGEQLQEIAGAFLRFRASNGYYPPDTVVGKLPPEARPMFRDGNPFQGLTPIGGQYDYEHHNGSGVLSINIVGSTIIEPPSLDDAMALDAYLDDGDLRTGNFRAIDGGFAYAFDRK